MGVIGIDVGVRSAAIVRLTDSGGIVPIRLITSKDTRWYELQALSAMAMSLVESEDDVIFIEEPPLAGPRNIRTALQLAQTVGALLASIPNPCYLVSVGQWKKTVVGKGNATKDEVAAYLESRYRNYSIVCDQDQNLIDAACIALYGQAVQANFM